MLAESIIIFQFVIFITGGSYYCLWFLLGGYACGSLDGKTMIIASAIALADYYLSVLQHWAAGMGGNVLPQKWQKAACIAGLFGLIIHD